MINFLLNNKKAAASVSVISNASLIILKLLTGFISGSVSIISEAIHSASDLLASFIALFAVQKADEPADSDHQFGHGKYEEVAGFAEGALIILASFYIIYEAGKKLTGAVEPISNSSLAIGVMFISVVVNIFVSLYLFKVAKKTDSIAIYSDAEHLRTDIFSSLAVLVGLVIIEVTGLHVIDSMMAVIVAMIIMHAGWKICKGTFNNLVDTSLPEKNINEIKNIIEEYKTEGIENIKLLKTRKCGRDKEIIIILLVKGDMTVRFSHALCDKLENKIEERLGNTKTTIHVEPLDCSAICCKILNE